MIELGYASKTRASMHAARNRRGIALTIVAGCLVAAGFVFRSIVGPDDWTWFVFSLLCFGAGLATFSAACFLCATLPSHAFRWSSLLAIILNLAMTTTAIYWMITWRTY